MLDPKRLETLFARASVVVNLLQSRLAMPLLYPINTGSHVAEKNPIAESKFTQAEITKSLAHITPIVIGMSRMATILKVGNALASYDGGAERKLSKPATEVEKKTKHKLHDYTRRINRKHRAKTITGLYGGWDRFGTGRHVENIQDRWTN
jgi:hypothetical protein